MKDSQTRTLQLSSDDLPSDRHPNASRLTRLISAQSGSRSAFRYEENAHESMHWDSLHFLRSFDMKNVESWTRLVQMLRGVTLWWGNELEACWLNVFLWTDWNQSYEPINAQKLSTGESGFVFSLPAVMLYSKK